MTSSSDSDAYEPTERKRRIKRRKTHHGDSISELSSISEPLRSVPKPLQEDPPVNELSGRVIDAGSWQEATSTQDQYGNPIRLLSRTEALSLIRVAESELYDVPAPPLAAIALRKLKFICANTGSNRYSGSPSIVSPLPPVRQSPMAKPSVIDALHAMRTTPFENSFLSRLYGMASAKPSGLIAVDWETVSPWMCLMGDIRAHYEFSHPDYELPQESPAPITYVWLQACHLEQVHDLLARVFWAGIDVSDSLDHSPERCTIVATYKQAVVGVAIMSSPREAYITYLAVKAGWDNSQIATTMLYHLITLNPDTDITLHVSANNAAMLLYNRFGFKAEEFVAGFYEDYLDPLSRASKNAFRLRLRRR